MAIRNTNRIGPTPTGGGGTETAEDRLYSLLTDASADILGEWRADDMGSPADATAVSSWSPTSRSTYTSDFAQATGTKQPIYRADYNSSGQPGVEFDGVDDWMATAFDETDTSFIMIMLERATVAASKRPASWSGSFFEGLLTNSSGEGFTTTGNPSVFFDDRNRLAVGVWYEPGEIHIATDSTGISKTYTLAGTPSGDLVLGAFWSKTLGFMDGAYMHALAGDGLTRYEFTRGLKHMAEMWGAE